MDDIDSKIAAFEAFSATEMTVDEIFTRLRWMMGGYEVIGTSLLMREGQPPRRLTAPSVCPKIRGLDLFQTACGLVSAIYVDKPA